jgi:hypothetical protein
LTDNQAYQSNPTAADHRRPMTFEIRKDSMVIVPLGITYQTSDRQPRKTAR